MSAKVAGHIVIAEVYRSGRAQGVCREGERIMAGGVGFAFDNVYQTGKSVIAGVAEPDARVNIIFVQPAEFHRKRSVQKNDSFGEVAFFNHLKHIFLVFIESHNAFGGVGIFGAVTAERYDCRVLKVCKRAFYCVVVFGGYKLGNLSYVVSLFI